MNTIRYIRINIRSIMYTVRIYVRIYANRTKQKHLGYKISPRPRRTSD